MPKIDWNYLIWYFLFLIGIIILSKWKNYFCMLDNAFTVNAYIRHIIKEVVCVKNVTGGKNVRI